MRYEKLAHPLATTSFTSARLAGPVPHIDEPMPTGDVDAIKAHLGGDAVLDFLGFHNLVVDQDHVSFKIEHPNPAGVHFVIISAQPRGMFNMDCYKGHSNINFKAELAGYAKQILPENLATVLGKLTGLEEIHHRHF